MRLFTITYTSTNGAYWWFLWCGSVYFEISDILFRLLFQKLKFHTWKDTQTSDNKKTDIKNVIRLSAKINISFVSTVLIVIYWFIKEKNSLMVFFFFLRKWVFKKKKSCFTDGRLWISRESMFLVESPWYNCVYVCWDIEVESLPCGLD